MRSRTSIISYSSMSSSISISLFHNTQQFLSTFRISLSQSWNLYTTIFIFHYIKQILIIQQIQTFTTIYLKISHSHSMFLSQFKQLLHQLLLQTIHCKSFTRTCLTISKTSYYPLLCQYRQ